MKQLSFFLLFSLSLLALSAQTRKYVDINGTPAGAATSWATACNDLQLVINNAGAGDTIWVAQGVYKPRRPANKLDTIDANNRDNAFVLKANVHIYGGFAGNEAIFSQRDWNAYPTILSGDIGTPGNSADNCYHVVVSSGNVGTACLDGFTITKGYANVGSVIVVNGHSISRNEGGGLYIRDSSPILSHLVIDSNMAIVEGGGICCVNSSLVLTDVVFSRNTSNNYGGGMQILFSTPVLTNVIFEKNTAGSNGGGIDCSNNSTLKLTNGVFVENSANRTGGFHNTNGANAILTNVLVINNYSDSYGGGISNVGSTLTLTNITVCNNISTSINSYDIGGVYNSGTLFVRNSIIWGNKKGAAVSNIDVIGITYARTLVGGATLTAGIILNGDPLFADTANGDYRLLSNSPCLDVGDNTFYNPGGTPDISHITVDLDNNPRINNATIDLGAYELQSVAIIPDSRGIVYVNKQVATGNGCGDSWYNAAKELADALYEAKTANRQKPDSIKQIWVAEGTYKPLYKAGNGTWDRDKAFVLVDSVKVYGGFPDTANDVYNTTLNDRDWNANPTILSGDIGIQGDNTDNCYHVVISAGDSTAAGTLDGFTVTGGNADGGSTTITVNTRSISRSDGGGIYNTYSSPILTNVTVSNNTATSGVGGGGGIYNNNSSPILTNVTVSNNTATNVGGGIVNSYSSPILTNVTVSNNTAGNVGGGIHNAYSSPILTNVTVSNNTATDGGGIYNQSSSSPILTNVTVSNNTATNVGGGIVNSYSSSPKIRNSIIWGNTLSNGTTVDNIYNIFSAPVYANTLVGGATIGSGIILNGDPLFADTANGDYRLTYCSPAINAGDSSFYSPDSIPDISHITTCLDNNPRIVNKQIDLGAYEFQATVPVPDARGTVHVNINQTTGDGSGDSWANAVNELSEALVTAKSNKNIKQIWVAEGTYKPLYHAADGYCNNDGGRDNAFVLVDSVKVYGGFPTNANDNRDTSILTRDWKNNPTVLSGDIGTVGSNTDNCYHVVIASHILNSTTTLDGFTVTGGNANGSNNISSNNQLIGRNSGGGMYIRNATFSMQNLTVDHNNTDNDGGGILCLNASPFINNVIIHNNTAGNGGGMMNYSKSSPVITNTLVYNNTSRNSRGGGIHNYGQYGVSTRYMEPAFINVTVANNTGGGINNEAGAYPMIYNSIIYNNNVSISDGLIDYRNSLVGGAAPGNGIILNTDPLFADAINGDYRLSYCSPAINKGDTSLYRPDSIPNISHITTDLDNNPRVYDGIIDLGAYEFQQNRILPSASVSMNRDTTICPHDSINIIFALRGTANWQLVYTADNGLNYDTLKNISSNPYSWKVNPTDTTTYRFVQVSDSHCDTILSDSVTIHVIPQFNLTNMFMQDTLCDGGSTTPISFTGLATGYQWSVTDTGIISGLPSGIQTGDFPAYTLANKTGNPKTNTIKVTPLYALPYKTCTGEDTSFSITVSPAPTVTNLPANDTLCHGNNTTPVNFYGVSTHYTWYAAFSGDTIDALPLGIQTGDFSTYLLKNETNLPVTAVIRVTPHYSLGSVSCPGSDSSFSITVNPKPTITNSLADQVLCHDGHTTAVPFSGVSTGYQWIASGDNIDSIPTGIQQGSFGTYNVSNETGNVLTSAITVTPLYQTGNLTCRGKDTSFAVSVNPAPVIYNILGDDTLCSGEQTMPVVFFGVLTNHEWTAHGDKIDSVPVNTQVGDFESYTVTNTTTSVQTATIRITPYYIAGGVQCVGKDTAFSISVIPEPTLTNVLADYDLCDGEQTSPVIFTGNPATEYQWSATGNIREIPSAMQTGNFGAYSLTNKTSSSLTSLVSVTPVYTAGGMSCMGESQDFYITVHPATVIHSISADSALYCEGDELNIVVAASGGNNTYQWYKDAIPLMGEVSQRFTVPVTRSSHSGYYYVEVSGTCGEAKSATIPIEVRDQNMLVEKWHDVILVDNSLYQYYGYQWYRDGIVIPGAKEQFYQEPGGLEGCYSVELTLKDGNKVFSCERCLEKKTVKSISIYPNLAKQGNPVNVSLGKAGPEKAEPMYVSLYTSEGKCISNKQFYEDSFEIETHGLATGIYILRITVGDKQIHNEKIIVY